MKTAIVVFNLGGPGAPDEVRPFLESLFNDPAIIGLPGFLRRPLARFIAARRTPKAQGIYAHMGGRSPILPQTQAQADALRAALPELDCDVFIAMRHSQPDTGAAAAAVRAYAPERIVLLPLYPQFSTTTTGSALSEWRRLAPDLQHLPQVGVCCYPQLNGYARVYAQGIRQFLMQQQGQPCDVLLSAHGLPEKTVNAGDPYQAQVEQSAAAIIGAVGAVDKNVRFRVCYQSKVGPLKWIDPSTDSCIEEAGHSGRGLVVCPIAFVSEHSETLVELDIEYQELAHEHKVPFYHRVPTVSDAPEFIAALADEVRRLLPLRGLQPPTSGQCGSAHRRCPISVSSSRP